MRECNEYGRKDLTLTLSELLDVVDPNGDEPGCAATALFAVLRTADQKEIATDEGILASIRAYNRVLSSAGRKVTKEGLKRDFASVMQNRIPLTLALEIMEAD
jgi:hypothetical protein